MASRIDCFSEVPVGTFGESLKQQVEDRLKYFETGEVPRKNIDVMHEATVAAQEAQVNDSIPFILSFSHSFMRRVVGESLEETKETNEKGKEGTGNGGSLGGGGTGRLNEWIY